MQEEKANAQNDMGKAIQAMERIMRGEDSDDLERLQEDYTFVGEVLDREYKAREKATKAKVPHLKGLQAANDFEVFCKTYFKDDLFHLHRSVDKLGDEICYEAIVSRILVDNVFKPDIMQEFCKILNESTGVDIGIEDEDSDYPGQIYFDISFPAIIRA